MRRLPPALPWLFLTLAAADLIAWRAGLLRHQPSVLAALFGLAGLALLARLVQLAPRLVRRDERRAAAVAEAVVVAGLLVALGGGMLNWLLGLQGFVVLVEGETAHLQRGAELQAFAAGPWARLEEMELELTLDEVELVHAGVERFYPLSRVRVWRAGQEPLPVEVTPHRWASSGPLRLHQGAFGFAPRIVVLAGPDAERTLADRVVPFVTERRGPLGTSFSGSLNLPDDELRIAGEVDLESLDEAMRGHATLRLTVDRGERRLGQGSLLPGHFAELAEGYRVGFAGLEMWSEIVISRRGYGQVVVAGAIVALLGAIAFPLVWLRQR